MTRHRSFQTAAARRRAEPIIWEIDGQEIRLRASIELADLASLIDLLQEPVPEGLSPMKYAVERRASLIEAIRPFVEEPSIAGYEQVAEDLDLGVIGEMISDLIAEYAGTRNPTKPSSSLPGSEETGPSSTDGVPLEASTPSASQPTEQ
jgi:hypothetical protein